MREDLKREAKERKDRADENMEIEINGRGLDKRKKGEMKEQTHRIDGKIRGRRREKGKEREKIKTLKMLKMVKREG